MRLSIIFLALAFFCISCTNTKKALYFSDQRDAVLPPGFTLPDPIIEKNDLLSISVSSLNPSSTVIFNNPNVTSDNNNYNFQGNSAQATGYLVTSEGAIQFPVLGMLKVTGLTENQLRAFISKELEDKKLLKDPIVSVRHLNFKVTVLGEVNHPTVITVANEKITLLEALGLAGDITIYGKRSNVLIIREVQGERTIKRLNLNASELFASPYYYLRSNDIVYVEPNKSRITASSKGTYLIPIILSGLSFMAIIADRITRKN